MIIQFVRRAIALTCFAFLSSSIAQAGTITVGPPGSGADFAEIQDAVDAALPGDTLLVLPGSYAPFSVSKPLSILGDGSQTVFVNAPTAGQVCSTASGTLAMEVSGLAANEEVFVSGMTVQETIGGFMSVSCPMVSVHDNLGTVALHDLAFVGNTIGIQVEANSLVLLESIQADQIQATGGLSALPSEALIIEDSSVWLMNSDLAGGGSPDQISSVRVSSGIIATNSLLYLADSTVVGGDGGQFLGECLPGGIDFVGQSGAAAIQAFGNTIIKHVGDGSDGSRIVGGSAGIGDCELKGGDGIVLGIGAQLLLQTDATVLGGQGNPAGVPVDLNGGSQVDLDFTYPLLASSLPVVSTGSSFSLTLEGNSFASGMLYLSLGLGPATAFIGVDGAAATNAAASILLATLPLDTQGTAGLNIPIPPMPALVGLVAYFQFLEIGGPQTALSNPVFVSIAR